MLCLFATSIGIDAQSIEIESTLVPEIEVCGASGLMTIRIANATGGTMTGTALEIGLPPGIAYVSGSLTETTSQNLQEQNVSQNTSLLFSANDLPLNDSLVFSIGYTAAVPAVTFQGNGGIFRNTVSVSYNGGSSDHESESYNVLYPAFSILAVTPNVQTIVSGTSTQRSISVINGGNGKIDAFYITDVPNNSLLTLLSTDLGVVSGDTIFFSGSDFLGIGNNDAWFDQNESFTVTETLTGTSCTDVTVSSSINVHWGCDGGTIPTSTSYANTTVDFQSPNLSLSVVESLDACFGAGIGSQQEAMLVNNGSGLASGLDLEIFKSSGSGYDQDIFSRIDPASLEYKVSANGNFVSVGNVTTTATNSSGDFACLGTNPIGKVAFSMPDLAPGDTIWLRWDMYACCLQTCEDDALKGWEIDLAYSDVCAIQTYSTSKVGQEVNHQYTSFFTEAPIDIVDGQEEHYLFTVSSFENTLPEGTGAHYKATFTLDDGLVYTNLRFHSNGTDWTPSQVNYNAALNVVEAQFPVSAPFDIPKSEIDLGITGTCGNAGMKTITLDWAYVPDVTCIQGCEIPLTCDQQVTTYLHCPAAVCNTLRVLDFVLERENFGAPDNNLDGLADASGSLNMAEVKAKRAMVGDTILATMSAVINPTSDTWQYSRLTSDVDHGAVLSFVDAVVTIYDASSTTNYTVAGLVPSTNINGNQQDFSYDLAGTNLAALNSALNGYTYAGGDSIRIDARYELVASVSGLIREVTFMNDFYVSDFGNPSSGQKENCNARNGRMTFIGYAWRNDKANNVTVTSCSRIIKQDFGMSIGDVGSNYGGGNLFPFEYRNWSNVKTITVQIPPNYGLVNATIKHYRTRRTNAVVTETVNNVVPDAIAGNTLTFDLEQYYLSNLLKYSDDGYHGNLSLELAPTCDVPENTFENIVWTHEYQKSSAIDGLLSGPINASGPDKIRYRPSNFTLLSNNPIQDANTRSIEWDFKVQNTSGSGADFAWIHIDAPSTIQIDSIVNDANNQALARQSDLFLLGTVNGNATANLTIYGTVSGCDTVNLIAYAGFECTGYPTDFASFSCSYQQLPLYVEPKLTGYQTRISTELMPDPCLPQLELVVDITNVKIAHLYDMSIDFITPDTSKIKVVSGTSMFQYNTSNPYSTVSDPAYGGGIYNYVINNFESDFAANGIPGVLDISNNRYRLKATLELGSQFSPGDFLQIVINGQNACTAPLPTVNLAYDPNSKFDKDNTAGLHIDIGNSWSASWGDYDNDGYDDLFVPINDLNTPNILYHNNGDGTFTNVSLPPLTTDQGASIAGTWGDYDNDGFLDLFVANNINSANKLYHNNGNGTFTSVTNNPIVDEGIYSHAASWADYNLDGNLDLVVSDFHPTNFNFLFLGDGQGGFEVDANSPVSLSATSAIGVAWGDYDNDGDPDLFIANTNGENNQLFRNDNGLFVAITTGNVVTDGGHSVGGIWGDYDNDGDLDLFVTNSSAIEPNFFYENMGNGSFSKITSGAIVELISNSHGASWSDYDNDMDLDLIVANDQNAKNYLFANNGDKTFTQITNAITEDQSDSYGTAWSDYDNDGDEDLFIANRGANANDFFINKKGACTNHIGFRLLGCNSNSFGIGAMIRVKATIGASSIWQSKHVSTQTSAMGGQNSSKLLFGLRDASSVDSVIIEWPSGVVTSISNPAINQIHAINEQCGSRICGTVFHDLDNDQVQDPGEEGIANRSLVVNPGNFQVITGSDGTYELYVEDGNYTLSMVADPDWTQTYPASNGSHSLTVVQANQSTYCGNDFGQSAVCTDPDLSLQLGTTAFRRGLTNMLNVSITNGGAYDAVGTILLDLTVSDNVYMVDSLWTNVSGNAPTRTYTYSLLNLAALSDTVFNLVDSVSATTGIDDPVSISASISYSGDECSLSDNDFSMADNVVGSIDPNDKLVQIEGYDHNHLALPGDRFLYKIRFQNLGNYAARIVYIIDTLSPDLDWNTFEMRSSSHPFLVSLVDGILHFRNNEIELPDSASDPLGSQGYVSFSIAPKAGLPPYTTIDNKAFIRFDYNEFIETNIAPMRIGRENQPEDSPFVLVYPDPAADQAEIMLVGEGGVPMQLKSASVYDLQGRLLRRDQINVFRHRIDVGQMSTGSYLLELQSIEGFSFRKKFNVIR